MFRSTFAILIAISAVLIEPLCPGGASEVSQVVVGQDPRLQLASQARQAIETEEKAVAESVDAMLAQLETAIAKLPSKTLEQEQLALDHLKDIAIALREQSEAVLSKRESYARNFEALQEALEAAPAAFRKAAQAFREYAEEEPFEDIKATYTSLAESWESLAATTEERAREAGGPNVAEWDESCRYIASIATFAKRLEEHLAAFPDADWLNRQHKYSEELKTLIKQFQELKSLLQQFNSKLTTQALARDLGRRSTEPSSSPNVQLAAYVPGSSAVPGRPIPSTVAQLQRQSPSPAPKPSQSSRPAYAERPPQAAPGNRIETFIPKNPLPSNGVPTDHRFAPRPQQPQTPTYYYGVPHYPVSYPRSR